MTRNIVGENLNYTKTEDIIPLVSNVDIGSPAFPFETLYVDTLTYNNLVIGSDLTVNTIENINASTPITFNLSGSQPVIINSLIKIPTLNSDLLEANTTNGNLTIRGNGTGNTK